MKRRSKRKKFLKSLILLFSIAVLGGTIWLYGTTDNLKNITFSYGASLSTRKIEGDGPMEGTGRPQTSTTLESPVNTGEEYTFDSTTYPYRALLGSEEQADYNQIYANAVSYNTGTFTLVNALSEDDLCETMSAVFNDHPELFWLNTAYSYAYNNSGNVVQVQLSYGISSNNIDTAKTSFDSAVAEIVSGASSYSTDIEKELYIHDCIAEKATYSENASLNQSAYSALVSGKTVCAGYARAFQIVCQQSGLTCYYVTGTAQGGDHAWNIISVSGNFYNVDLTWDDTISESYGSNVYTYFNLTDSDISADHTRSTLSSKLPSCTATDMSYTNVYGTTVTIDDINSSDNSQITDGNFTINEPQQPVVDWHDGPASGSSGQNQNNQQINGNQQVPQNNQQTNNNQQVPQNNQQTNNNPQIPQNNQSTKRINQAPGKNNQPVKR